MGEFWVNPYFQSSDSDGGRKKYRGFDNVDSELGTSHIPDLGVRLKWEPTNFAELRVDSGWGRVAKAMQPHFLVNGGDHAGFNIPEASIRLHYKSYVQAWGGILPASVGAEVPFGTDSVTNTLAFPLIPYGHLGGRVRVGTDEGGFTFHGYASTDQEKAPAVGLSFDVSPVKEFAINVHYLTTALPEGWRQFLEFLVMTHPTDSLAVGADYNHSQRYDGAGSKITWQAGGARLVYDPDPSVRTLLRFGALQDESENLVFEITGALSFGWETFSSALKGLSTVVELRDDFGDGLPARIGQMTVGVRMVYSRTF